MNPLTMMIILSHVLVLCLESSCWLLSFNECRSAIDFTYYILFYFLFMRFILGYFYLHL